MSPSCLGSRRNPFIPRRSHNLMNTRITQLIERLSAPPRQKISEVEPRYDFRSKNGIVGVSELQHALWQLATLTTTRQQCMLLLDALLLSYQLEDAEDRTSLLEQLKKIVEKLPVLVERTRTMTLPSLPKEIKSEITADVQELETCFAAGAYRSCVVLCGRILETALHRKYYEATGQDILEKSPGIGLGNLIAKMKEKGINLDPALANQIHLINQVRVFSVHKKQEAYSPSKAQAQAIILYTMDSISQLFSK